MKLLNSHKHKLLALGVCLVPAVGFAQQGTVDELSYGYIELDYINLDVDQPGEDGDPFDNDFDNGGGWGISASVPITEAFFLYGDYTETESDFGFRDNLNVFVPGNVDIIKMNLGLGFVMPMSERTDMVFSGGYTDLDYDRFRLGASGDPSTNDLRADSSDGFTIDARLRSQLSTMLEGSIGARYTDIQDIDGLSLISNLMWEFSPNWGLNLSLDAGDDLMTWGMGVRYSY